MRRIIPLLSIAVFCTFCAGCIREVNERSNLLTETVKARDLVYTPAVHGSGMGPTMRMTKGGGIGLGLAITSVNTEEVYSIVFECQHGGFVIQREELWKKLHKDSTYHCRYVELYRTVYDGKPDTLVSRTLVGYDFLGLEEFPDLMEKPDEMYHPVK